MKICLTLLCIVLVVSPYLGQTRPKTKPRRAAATTSKPDYSLAEFDPDATSLPPNYKGHSFLQIYQNLYRRRSRLLKGEYETTVQYENRLPAEYNVPVLGSLTLNNAFAIQIYDLETAYDADLQQMTVAIDSKFASDEFDGAPSSLEYSFFNWLTTESKKGSYIGSNSFGVKRRVSVYHVYALLLAVPRAVVGMSYVGDYKVQFSLGPAEAKALNDRLRALFIGSIRSPFVGEGQSEDKATIDNPSQVSTLQLILYLDPVSILIYDGTTGRILARRNLSGGK